MMSDYEQADIQIDDIRVVIKRKKIKNLYLRVERESLQVIVSAPLRMPVGEIRSFVYNKKAWLQQKIALLSGRKAVFQSLPVSEGCLWLWGEKYTVKFLTGKGKPVISDKQIVFYGCENTGEAGFLKAAEIFYREQLTKRIEEMAGFWQQRMHLYAAEWRIRKMKSRWGTCNVSSGSITLNYNLVRLPVQCLELVIVHELAHLFEASHSKRFKNFVAMFLPDWKQREGLLKNFTF